jgi:hypothetical protein
MRRRTCLFFGVVILPFLPNALAQGHRQTVAQASRAPSPSHRHAGAWSHARSPHFGWNVGASGYWPYSGYTFSPFGLQSYVWPYSGFSYFGSPYAYGPEYEYSDYFPHFYFFDLYNREAQQSKEEADNFEASFADQKPASSASPRSAEAAALSPREVVLIIDGQRVAPSAAGYPLVVGSGQHILRIAAKPPTPAEKNAQD